MSAIFNPLDYKQAFAYPKYLHPQSNWIQHTPFAMMLVEMLRPRTVVELGTHRGVSYLAFCQAIAALNISCRSFAVDTWEGDPQAGFYGQRVYEKLLPYHQGYEGFSKLMRTKFDEAVQSFEDGSIDILHIDGFHSYEAVKHDFLTWQPKLTEQSVVLFHDISVLREDFGVHKLWNEVRRDYPSFSFQHGYGLGVLGTGRQLDPAVSAFFDVSADQEEATRALFSRLGQSLQNDVSTSPRRALRMLRERTLSFLNRL